MVNNKIVYNNQVLIDLTGDNVIESDVAQGKIFHKADGTQAIGTASGGGDTLLDAYTETGFTYENDTLITVPDNMLRGSKIVELTLPSCTSIGQHALYSCTSLTSIVLASLTSIGNSAFSGCTALTGLSLGELLTIGSAAFSGCTGLTSAIFSKATSLGAQAFQNCINLNTITFSTLTTIPNYAFYLNGATYKTQSKYRTISIPECTSIRNNAFQYNKITSISLPKIVSIGNNAFDNCNFTQQIITIPATFDGVINQYAFGCSNPNSSNTLKGIVFEGDVTSIARQAFYGCENCTVYDFSHCTEVPTLANYNAFEGIQKSQGQIRVPASLEADWKAADNWVWWKNYIVGV